jgi:hypothetical protein
MSSETVSAPVNALAFIPLPEVHALSQQQVRGITCVFDGVALSPATAVDLGERQGSDGTGWFPRACRSCAMERSMVALQEHSGWCEQCTDDYLKCETGRGLVRAVREARR